MDDADPIHGRLSPQSDVRTERESFGCLEEAMDEHAESGLPARGSDVRPPPCRGVGGPFIPLSTTYNPYE
jgi:hypothetical protein